MRVRFKKLMKERFLNRIGVYCVFKYPYSICGGSYTLHRCYPYSVCQNEEKMSISAQNYLSDKETERSIVALFRSDNSELDFARFSAA